MPPPLLLSLRSMAGDGGAMGLPPIVWRGNGRSGCRTGSALGPMSLLSRFLYRGRSIGIPMQMSVTDISAADHDIKRTVFTERALVECAHARVEYVHR